MARKSAPRLSIARCGKSDSLRKRGPGTRFYQEAEQIGSTSEAINADFRAVYSKRLENTQQREIVALSQWQSCAKTYFVRLSILCHTAAK